MDSVNRASRKIKILFIITQSEQGGAQRYVLETAKNLNKEKYQILVAAGEGDGGLFGQLSETDILWHPLKKLKRTPWPWQFILAVSEILGLLKKEKPQILFLCSTSAGVLGSFASFIYKKLVSRKKLLVIYRIGGWAFRDPRHPFLNKIIFLAEKLTSCFKDKIVVNSEVDLRLALNLGIAPVKKIVKIYNGIDAKSLNFFTKETARKKLVELSRINKEPEIIIGTVANFYKTKGLEYFIKAAAVINKKYKLKNIKYFVIGDGRERNNLKKIISKEGLQNDFLLLGKISDAYRFLPAFDVFVLPSLKEGFPWIILEAMAAKLPVIATSVGAIPEIIDDKKDGILVGPKNSGALSEEIFWVLSNKEESQKMGIAGAKKIDEKFSLKKMVEETEKLFIVE